MQEQITHIQVRLRASEARFEAGIDELVDAQQALDHASNVDLVGTNAEARRIELQGFTVDERAELKRAELKLELAALEMKNARAELVTIGRNLGAYPAE